VAKQTTSTPEGKAAADGAGSRPVRQRAAAAGGTRAGGGGGVLTRASANRTSVRTFYDQTIAELKKVTWPTRQETLNLTVAVIAMTLAIAAFLGAIDASLDKLVQVLIG